MYSFLVHEEKALLFFTLLFQMSLGSVFVAALVHLRNKSENLQKRLFLLSGILSLCAIVVSTFHLGNPFHGFWILTKFYKPLPLEVIFLLLFSASSFVLYKLESVKSVHIHILLILGLLTLVCMSLIYGTMSSTNPAWNAVYVFLRFFSATCILGGAFSYLVMAHYQGEEAGESLHYSVWLGLGGLLIELLYLPFYQMTLSEVSVGGHALLNLVSHYTLQLAVFIVLMMVGFVLWLHDLRIRHLHEWKGSKGLVYLSFCLLIVAFLFERNIFYSLGSTTLF